MKRNILYVTGLIIITAIFVQCNSKQEQAKEYKKNVKEWRKNRMESLKSEDGWLNLAGLLWLEEGKNTIGSAEESDIAFPEKAPDNLGAIYLNGDSVHFKSAEDVEVTHNGNPVRSITMKTDMEKNTTVLKHGQLKWFIIDRNGKLAIRLRDLQREGIRTLPTG